MKSPFKVDFIFEEIEDLLRITNQRLANIERLLEFTLSPPDLVQYKKGMSLDDIPRKKLSDEEK